MDRGRGRGRGRRRGQGSSHHQPSGQHYSDSTEPDTPVAPAINIDQQAAPSTQPSKSWTMPVNSPSFLASSPSLDSSARFTPRSERPARSNTHNGFTFTSPTPASVAIMAPDAASRKRSRTFEPGYGGAGDDDANSKGGHSLRKRARIDYTQDRIDDDVAPFLPRPDLTAKPAALMGPRGRKRRPTQDLSDAESEDLLPGQSQKRRRADRSPTALQGTPSRRKNPQRKSTTEIRTYTDEPSDHEVQDTILVGAPIDESDQSSFQHSPGQSTSGGSDGDKAEVQPETPDLGDLGEVRNVEEKVIVATPDELEHDLVKEEPVDKTESDLLQVPVSRSAQLLDPVPAPEDVPLPESDDADPPRTDQVLTQLVTPPPLSASFENQTAEVTADHEPQPPQIKPPPVDSTPDVASPAPSSQPDQPQPTVSVIESSPPREAATSQPRRLKALEKLYKEAGASKNHLAPYEKGEVVYPSPYTEWLQPDSKPESTPIPSQISTPALAPVPEPIMVQVRWDGRRSLKNKEFYELYRAEKARRKQAGEPQISMTEFHNECCRRYKTAQDTSPTETSSPADPAAQLPAKTAPATQESPVKLAEIPVLALPEPNVQQSQDPDSLDPTEAQTPELNDEDVLAQDDQEVEETAEDVAKGNDPTEPIEVTRIPKKQFSFAKLRELSEFTDRLKNYSELSTEDLCSYLADLSNARDAYQAEYLELKKIPDDEENAKRRVPNDKTASNWDNRQKLDDPLPWRRHDDEPAKGPAAFEIRGVRAPKPYIDDPVMEHQRQEDKIMAQAYGFKHANLPALIGKQSPDDQRWEMPEPRLRERKQTQKAADLAEENVLEGKRARKPRVLSDQGRDASRAPTPAAPIRRRRRNGDLLAAVANSDRDSVEPGITTAADTTPRRRRGPPPRTQPQSSQEDTAQDQNGINGEGLKVGRKRGRVAAPLAPPTSAPLQDTDADIDESAATRPKRQRTARMPRDSGASSEIHPSSFYANSSQAGAKGVSRASTPSSTDTTETAETAESSYSLRDKKKRNYAIDNDPEAEHRPKRTRAPPARTTTAHAGVTAPEAAEPVEPPKKRIRRRKQNATPAPGPLPLLAAAPLQKIALPRVGATSTILAPPRPGNYLHSFETAPVRPSNTPQEAPRKVNKIRIKNGSLLEVSQAAGNPSPVNPLAPNTRTPILRVPPRPSLAPPVPDASSTVAGSLDGLDMPDKPYAEMSKSEKMSWSMKKRWARGEMRGAVEKRKSTLAMKAQARATNAGGPEVEPQQDGERGSSSRQTSTAPSRRTSITPSQFTAPTPVPLPVHMPPQPQPTPDAAIPSPPAAPETKVVRIKLTSSANPSAAPSGVSTPSGAPATPPYLAAPAPMPSQQPQFLHYTLPPLPPYTSRGHQQPHGGPTN